MKKLVIIMVFLMLGQSFAAVPMLKLLPPKTSPHLTTTTSQVKLPTADYKLCGLCVQFAGQFINILLNIVLNAGVVHGCADLCQLLPDASKVELEVCNILCDLVGVKEFVKIIEEADLDPIYYCELLGTCLIKDDGDATVGNITISPNQIPYGDNFEITFFFSTKNGTGTGEVNVFIHTQDGIPLGATNLLKPLPPNQQVGGRLQGTAALDPDCDVTKGPCEMWVPGNYSVEIAICNGECGSKHPHSSIYDHKSAPFTVVRN